MNAPIGPCDLHDPRRSKRPRQSAGQDESNPNDQPRHDQPFNVADLVVTLDKALEGYDYFNDTAEDDHKRHSAPPPKASLSIAIGPPSPSAPSDPIIRQAGPSLACSPKWARVMSDLQEQLSVLVVPAASSIAGRAVVAGEAKKKAADSRAFATSPSLRRSRHWSCLSLVSPLSEQGAAATLHCQCAGACCCVDAGAARYLVDQACGPDVSALLLLGDEERAAKIPAREGCGSELANTAPENLIRQAMVRPTA